MTHILIGGNNDEHWVDIRQGLLTGEALKWRAVPKGCRPGDSVLIFLDGGGFATRGQIASVPERHPEINGRYTGHVEVTEILPEMVPLEFVRTRFPSWKWPDAFRPRYTTIDGDTEYQLETVLNHYPDSSGAAREEGGTKQSPVTSYDRDPRARLWCIKLYGRDCYACGFSFKETYGEIADGYIHVHHLTPLSRRRGQYKVNPLDDLRPLCPNCHAVVHRQDPPLSISELRDLIDNPR